MRKQTIEYCDYSNSIRLMPQNYCLIAFKHPNLYDIDVCSEPYRETYIPLHKEWELLQYSKEELARKIQEQLEAKSLLK